MSPSVPETVIRKSRKKDDRFIADLARRAFGEYTTRPTVGHGVTWVAVSNERPLGFVTIDLTRHGRAAVVAIAVDPDEQGKGVGRRLMRAAEQCARASGARLLELYTAEANVAALDLFHKSGLQIVRRVQRFYPRGQNACLLEKKLARSPSQRFS